jgi:hypothetical protein
MQHAVQHYGVGAYSLALPLGQYPLGILPDKGTHTMQKLKLKATTLHVAASLARARRLVKGADRPKEGPGLKREMDGKRREGRARSAKYIGLYIKAWRTKPSAHTTGSAVAGERRHAQGTARVQRCNGLRQALCQSMQVKRSEMRRRPKPLFGFGPTGSEWREAMR